MPSQVRTQAIGDEEFEDIELAPVTVRRTVGGDEEPAGVATSETKKTEEVGANKNVKLPDRRFCDAC